MRSIGESPRRCPGWASLPHVRVAVESPVMVEAETWVAPDYAAILHTELVAPPIPAVQGMGTWCPVP